MANFPSTLPAPMLSGYQIEQSPAFIRTEMETGTARVRRRFSKTPYTVTVRWTLSATQMTTFKSFFETDILRGSAWFNISLDIGSGFQTYEARFMTPWSGSMNSSLVWDVSAKLEIQIA